MDKQRWILRRLVPEYVFDGMDAKILVGKALDLGAYPHYAGADPNQHVIEVQARGRDPFELVVVIDRLIYELEAMRRDVMKAKGKDD